MYDSGMRVLFVSPNTERLNIPVLPLGLALVAAAAQRAGHQTRFLNLLGTPAPMAAVRQAMQETKVLLEPVRDVVAACRAASPAKLVVGGAG